MRRYYTTALLLSLFFYGSAQSTISKERIMSDRKKPILENVTIPEKTCRYLLNRKIDADYIIIPRIISRMDILNKQKRDSLAKFIAECRVKIANLKDETEETQILLSNAGKPFDSNQKALIETIYYNYKNGISKELKSYLEKPLKRESLKTRNIRDLWNIASLTTQGPLNEKDRQAIEKDISKGLIPKKLKNHYKFHGYSCSRKIDSLFYFVDNTYYRESLYKELGWDNWVEPQEKYYDTIPNPVLAEVSKCKILDGWEWLRKEGYEEVSDSYPYSVRYLKFRNHPEYKVCEIDIYTSEKIVYSQNGELVYVSGIGIQDGVREGDIYQNYLGRNASDIGRQFARIAYGQNAYDIKSQSAKINHYIKNQLGLEEMTDAEKKQRDKTANAMASAMLGHAKSQMQYGNSRKGQRQQRKYAGKFMGALMGGSSSYYSSEGSSWFDQIEEDIWRELSNDGLIRPLKAKRLDGKTFVYYYGNKNGEILYNIIYRFQGTKPFEYKFTAKVEKYSPRREQKSSFKLDDEHALFFTSEVEMPPIENSKKDESQIELINNDPVDNNVYTSVEQMPQYPGGDAALLDDVAKNICYPSAAQENGIEGRVVVRFVVTQNGSVGDVQVVRGKDPDLDKEAKRVIKTVKKFSPGKMNGKAVNVWYTLPVTFRLNK